MIRERLRGRLEAWLLRVWFGPASVLDRLLAGLASPVALPLSWLVAAVARRQRRRILRQEAGNLTTPVVVVGNLVAGGSGKTPMVVAIARGLLAQGFRPGLLASGYRSAGARQRRQPGAMGVVMVDSTSDAAQVGDEAVLLALETGLPLAVGKNRAAAAGLLRRLHPECDVIVSDDGLQHVGLARRLELVVIDDRGFGNRRCLPAGPLREPADRLESVDAMILMGNRGRAPLHPPLHSLPLPQREFRSAVQLLQFRSLDGLAQWEPEEFCRLYAGEPMSAIAGIAQPQRFFASLDRLGLRPGRYALSDHARIDPAWLAALPGRWLLMTGKDAVKCRGFDIALRARCASLDVAAMPDPALLTWLVAELRPPLAAMDDDDGLKTARYPRVPDLQGPAAP